MQKQYLRKIEGEKFEGMVNALLENFPEFLSKEKEELLALLEVMRKSSFAVRKNQYGVKLRQTLLPRLWEKVKSLKAALKGCAAMKEEDANILKVIESSFKKRRDRNAMMSDTRMLCGMNPPANRVARVIFEDLQEYYAKCVECMVAFEDEATRIITTPKVNTIRAKIIQILSLCYVVCTAKAYMDGEDKESAAKFAFMLDFFGKWAKRFMPKGRKGKATGDNCEETEVFFDVKKAEEEYAKMKEGGGSVCDREAENEYETVISNT